MLKIKRNIELSGGCDQTCVQDTVGVYHATNNPTGWGVPNNIVGDATLVEIRMEKYLGNNIFDEIYSIDASGTLPNTDDVTFCFTSAEIENVAGDNYGDKFPDGVYRVKYFIECGANLTYVAEGYITVRCEAKCCLNIAVNKLGSQDCDKQFESRYSHLKLQFDLLDKAIECGDIQSIYDYLDYITKLCSQCGCSCK